MAKRRKNKQSSIYFIVALIIFLIVGVYEGKIVFQPIEDNSNVVNQVSYDLTSIPEYSNTNYVVLNNNEPNFTESDYTTDSFESYSKLDSLGRAKVAYANIGVDLMPTLERGSIGQVKPSGWHLVKYDIVNGKYLYNRCHLIGFQLTGENANEKNLITCTRQMNNVGMLEFENKVANYIKSTNNHVLYRVTPIYKDDNLLASGVVMEAYSVEDSGEGIKFNVFVYNVQDGIDIDYKTGDSKLKNNQVTSYFLKDIIGITYHFYILLLQVLHRLKPQYFEL